MNILDEIVQHKRGEVKERKSLTPIKVLEQSPYFTRACASMSQNIRRKDKTGIIAEFKRKSPSKGVINAKAMVDVTTRGYEQAGASALSVLTDELYFGGRSEDLTIARQVNNCPIIRKDFTIDEYQIIEAKSIGADAILLIAAVLDPAQSKKFAAFARSLGMETLLEVHDEDELKRNLDVGADLIGVNNRNLKTFEVSIDVSKRLAPLIPDHVVRVSESGISSAETILVLRDAGFEGFLMGENFMKHERPDLAALGFMENLRKAESGKQKA